jgi:hypothetical protein
VEIEMTDIRSIRSAAPILIGAAVMLSLSMGVRQSLGLVMPSLTRDIAISVSEFTLALSVQNLAWGALQPFAGALVVRVGFRPVMLTGAALYCAGLLLFAGAHGLLGVMLGAGASRSLARRRPLPWPWHPVRCRRRRAAWCWASSPARDRLGRCYPRRLDKCSRSHLAGAPRFSAFWRLWSRCCPPRGSPEMSTR